MTDTAQGEMIAALDQLVMAETPTNDLALIDSGLRIAAAMITTSLGVAPEVLRVDGRGHLRVRGDDDGVLVLCHLDTVWPAGTTARWPFTVTDGRATGPGAFDMKAGLVQGLFALRGFDRLDAITLLVTTDEEIGSPTSRALIEHEARRARAVLVLEPGLGGQVKVARKGVSMYHLAVTGRAAHAGLEPERGINALVELAAQVPVIASFGDAALGTSSTPTLAQAGSTVNTVPASAHLDIDVRAWTLDEQARVDRAMHSLTPSQPGAVLDVTGGVNRPPLEDRRSFALVKLAQESAEAVGIPWTGTARVGGASDGNFTGALGVPTLDGLGAVGAGAHAEGEYVDVTAMPGRAAMLRALIERIVALPSGALAAASDETL
jgi:glutamate carboxypeptidase